MSEEIKKEINLLKGKVLAVLDKYKFRRTNLFAFRRRKWRKFTVKGT